MNAWRNSDSSRGFWLIPPEYWKKVWIRIAAEERSGQAHFNTLQEMNPTLAEQIRGTDKDPFYFSDNEKRLTDYLSFLNENWA